MQALSCKYYFPMLIYFSDIDSEEKGTDTPKLGCLGRQFNCLLVHLLLSHAAFISHPRYNLILQQGRGAVVVVRLVP